MYFMIQKNLIKEETEPIVTVKTPTFQNVMNFRGSIVTLFFKTFKVSLEQRS